MKTRFHLLNYLAGIASLAGLYFGSAKLGLSLALSDTVVSPVWPPTGIAFAAVLMFGYRIWPAIALGAFVANYSEGLPLLTASSIAVGNTLEAITARYLLLRFVGSRNPLNRPQDIFYFVLLAGILSTTVSATIGTVAIYSGGFHEHIAYGYLWWTWWLGDMVGGVMVAPLILTWSRKFYPAWNRRKFLDLLLLLVAVFGVSLIFFSPWLSEEVQRIYLAIPFVVWATYRFQQRGASTASCIVAAVAIFWTQNGFGPFITQDMNASLLSLQIFMATVTVSALILGAAVEESKSAQALLVGSETKYRNLTEQMPAVTYVSEFGVNGRWLYVSPQIETLLGFTPNEWMEHPEYWIAQMHPVDRDRVVAEEDSYRDSAEPFHMEYRIYTRDGRLLWLRDEGVVLPDTRAPHLYQGILVNITERKLAEEALLASREKYESLVQSIDGIVWEANAQTLRISFVSKQAERILGYPAESWLLDANFWLKHVHPEDKEFASALYRKAAVEGKTHQFEYRLIAADGRIVWLRDLVSVTADNGDSPVLRGVMLDITEQKKSERLEAALYRIAEKASLIRDINDFYAAMHSIVGELMYAKNFYIALYDHATQRATFPYYVDEFDVPPPPESVHLEKGLTAYVLRTGEPLLATPEKFKELVQQGEVESIGTPSLDWLGVPLKTGDKTFGILAVQSYSEKIRFGEAEKDILTFVSQHIAAAIERKESEVALRASEEQYRLFFEEDLTGDYISTPEGTILSCNAAYARIFGFSSVEEAMCANTTSLYENPDDREAFLDLLQQERKLEYHETELLRKNGDRAYLIENAIGVFDEKGELKQIKGYIFDITEHKKLEEQLRQAQKIKAIGQLAGGVAHDFNNTLMAITGYCDLLLMRLPADDPLRQDAIQIQKAANHGAALTRQLLAFSRKQVLSPRVLDLNQALADMDNMLKRLIGEDVELSILPGARLGSVKVDPGQFQQVIFNLAVNAREAMPEGGRLILETSNSFLDDVYAHHHVDVLAGPYVMIAVSDTGSGMDEATAAAIFEPFFTTKEKGTGLGLSTVYGIVQQSGGHIAVYSECGKGTTFKIYLPRIDEAAESPVMAHATIAKTPCSGTILLVDDNSPARCAIAAALELRGFQVQQAGSAQEALEISRNLNGSIDVLVSDVVMPQISGRELARRLLMERPDLKVLYISGYSEEVLQTSLEQGSAFLMKPVSMQTLIERIQHLLRT